MMSFIGIVCGLLSWGYWCVCVAMSSWVCHSIVSRFVHLVRSGAWGLVPRCMYQSGWGFFHMQVHWVLPGWVIVVVEEWVSIGVGYIRIMYIPGSVGCGSLR